MKNELENLLQEINERMEYFLKKADDEENKSAIGHYIEAKAIKEKLEEIIYEKDNR